MEGARKQPPVEANAFGWVSKDAKSHEHCIVGTSNIVYFIRSVIRGCVN
jgi:hypothetical protein